jgi:hypothetical protein
MAAGPLVSGVLNLAWGRSPLLTTLSIGKSMRQGLAGSGQAGYAPGQRVADALRDQAARQLRNEMRHARTC